ncbi:DUF4174 domain-containing protein [Vibrio hippocampi]|uniref:DUF4174 domain-containing protein n=1 Tax=Vibrio hippocampi TaxID=654686 RepID=A0ABN8DKR4_9VIBR|nr:DUF4174 domain-containing protein [Vibrio hippocampi]CAH0529700.1 hypothetical protein VHP8226_03455 [Vibrio hippocampi]
MTLILKSTLLIVFTGWLLIAFNAHAMNTHTSSPTYRFQTVGQHYHGYAPHRRILYFAPSKDEHVDNFLLGTLSHQCALEERDVVIIVFTEDGFVSPKWLKDVFDYNMLKHMHDLSQGDHTAILIGKDGTEKLRWGTQTDWSLIKSTIDEMPMRQAEMRSGSSRCTL